MQKPPIEEIENEIMERLDRKESVYIESGAAVDKIMAYSVRKWQQGKQRKVIFETTACMFPKYFTLPYFRKVDTEEYAGELYVRVM